MVRALTINKVIYSYNVKSQNLFQCKTRITAGGPSPPAPSEEPIDDQTAENRDNTTYGDNPSGKLSKRPTGGTPRKDKSGRRHTAIDEADRIQVDTVNVFKH